jgi:hypothetical protein
MPLVCESKYNQTINATCLCGENVNFTPNISLLDFEFNDKKSLKATFCRVKLNWNIN